MHRAQPVLQPGSPSWRGACFHRGVSSRPPAGSDEHRRRLGELARLFLRLGTLGFGGPAAHIALMEDEVVRRRAWLTRGEFLDLVGASNLIPGPNSTELAIHIGRHRAGGAGLVVAGACFILPAMVIVMACAWAYVTWGTRPELGGVLYGVKPVVLAVVVQAIVGLTRTAVKTRALAALALVAAAAAFAGMNELLVLAVAGLLAAGLAASPAPTPGARAAFWPVAFLATGTAVAAPFSLGGLFGFFLKVGAVLYGSGYVLLAFLRSGLVEHRGWLTEAQLLDAVAVGQVTPGPVFTTATFIGYLLGGGAGAVVATAGIFLPAFVFVAVSGPLVPWIRSHARAGAFLDGVNVASLALMAAVTVQLARAALTDGPSWLLGGAAAVLLVKWRVNSTWLVLAGAAVGAGLSLLQTP